MIDIRLLEHLGLEQLPEWERDLLLEHLSTTLELRVGRRIARELPAEQLGELEAIAAKDDQRDAAGWLSSHAPGYREIVAEELARVKRELADVAVAILTGSLSEAIAASAPETASASAPASLQRTRTSDRHVSAVSVAGRPFEGGRGSGSA